MSITRINEFEAQAGRGDTLHALLQSILPMITTSDGCRACRLLQHLDAPTKFVIIEEWDSVEAHQASVKNIPPGVLQEAMTLLVAPPKGAYYQGSR